MTKNYRLLDTRVIDACKKQWKTWKSDCSGFVKAVASELDISLTGNADNIVNSFDASGWILLADGAEAAKKAEEGWFVLAGLEAKDHAEKLNKKTKKLEPVKHGHVAVVVKGELAKGKYPTAYWGQYGGTGAENKTLNYSWTKADLGKVLYAARHVVEINSYSLNLGIGLNQNN